MPGKPTKSAAASAKDTPTKKRDYLERYANYCRFMSMWPREDINFARYWIIFFMVTLCSLWIMMAMYSKILLHNKDIDGIAEVIDFATVYTSGFFRFIYAYVKGRSYLELKEFIEVNFVHVSFGRGDKVTMDPIVKRTKKLIYFYQMSAFIWYLQMVFGPIIIYHVKKVERFDNGTYVHPDLELKMTIDVPMPFDMRDQTYLVVTYLLHVMSYTAMTNIYIATDTFWFATLMLTIAQFNIISHSLRNILRGADGLSPSKVESYIADETELKEIERDLISCIKQHQLLRQCVHKIEVLMHPTVLVDFLHAVTSISFIMLDIVINLNEGSALKLINLAEYLIISLFHMFMLDYLGNELSLKENEISSTVYEIPWYNYPDRLKHKILIMTTLSRNPLRLTGGKLYSISLDFFVATIKTTFSYFMVLLQLRSSK